MNENLNTNLEEGQAPQSEGAAVNGDQTNADNSLLQPETKVDNSSQVGDTPSTVLSQEVKANITDSLDNPPVAPQEKSRLGCWSVLWWCIKKTVKHWRITLILITFALIAYGVMVVYRSFTSTDSAVDKPIAQSPEEIVHLRSIGQWEFLSVESEELVERHHTGLMSDRDLICIYRGTLRIGVDLRKLPEDWVEVKGRNAIVHLPQPSLLDENFLDETRTTVFMEQGLFRAEEREAMIAEAKNKMKQRALSPDNLSIARRNAESQFQKLFHAMGYEDVIVEFAPQKDAQHKN
jgi:hypothetical protein